MSDIVTETVAVQEPELCEPASKAPAEAREFELQRLAELEQRVQEKSAYARSLIECSIDALAAINPEGVITDVNQQMEALTGCPRQELIGTLFREYFTDPERAEAGVRLVLETGKVTDYELIARSRDGRATPVAYNAATFYNQHHELEGVFAAARDITDRKKLEQELRDKQLYTRSLIESRIDALATISPNGLITDVNQHMEELTGCSRQELIGTPFRQCFTDPERAEAGVRLVLQTGKVTDYELVARHRNGHQTPVAYNAVTFYDQRNELQGVFAAARDITDRKKLEQELREKHVYTRSLIESSIDALATISPDGRITDVNHQMEELTGWGREQLIGAPFRQYFSDPERAEAGVRLVLETGKVTDYELLARHRDGRQTPVAYNATTFYNERHQLQGVFAAARDITDRKRLEDELRDKHLYTRSLIESRIDALATINPDGVITDVNQHMEVLTGRPRQELIGTPFRQHFTDPERAEAGVRLVLETGKVTDYELTARSREGRQTTVAYNAATFYNQQHELQGVFAAARDVTDRKKLEQQLFEKQLYSRSLLESSIDALCAISPQGVITDVNHQMEELTGRKRQHLMGTAFRDYFTNSDAADAGVRMVLETGRVVDYELVARHRDGHETPVAYNASTFYNQEHELQGVFAAARDISERKWAEQEVSRAHAELEDKVRERTADLAAANQELEAFTYSVSHDLRAPLRHVDSFAKLLSDHLGSPADQQTAHYISRIRAGTERMSRLVESLLNLSRLGRQEMHREATPLGEIVDAVIRELEIGERRIDWKASPLPIVRCDPALIKQVFLNLLGNAVKFTAPRERAVVEIGLVPATPTTIYVRDNGVGFDMKYADKLFGAFQRLHPPEQFPGTGIGLATVRRIIVKHGGQIWAEAAPDAGATFYFTLGPANSAINNSGSDHNAN